MNRRTYRLRQLAVLALGAITVVSGTAVIGAGTAGATPTNVAINQVSPLTLGSPGTPATVYPSVANQAATPWTFTLQNTFGAADTLVIKLPQCTNATNFVGFAAAPQVSVVPASPTTETTPTFVATLSAQTGDGLACTGSGVKDQLNITLTNNSGPSDSPTSTAWAVTIHGVSYTVGSAYTATGDVPMTGLYVSGATLGGFVSVNVAANATVADFSITANNPPVGVQPGSTNQAISNGVAKEYTIGAIGTGTVTVTLNGGSTFAAASTPIVTITPAGTGATAGAVTGMGTAALSFPVTHSTTAPATYTLSGLRVDASNNSGPVNAVVTESPEDYASPDVQAFSIIGSSRIQGQVATDTSANLFQSYGNNQQDGCLNTAVLATSDNYPDALSAAYLAGNYNTAVIITPTAAVAQVTLNALRLEGVQTVLVVGGPLAISPADIATLQSTPSYHPDPSSNCNNATGLPRTHSGVTQMLVVTQIWGQDQYGTAQQVAQYVAAGNIGLVNVPGAYGGTYNDTTGANGTAATSAPTSSVQTAILAVGTNFPDAMAASAMSWAGGSNPLPILLTEQGSLAPEAAAAIINLGIQQVIVMGGPVAISDNVLTQLEATGVSTFRIAGHDYTDTAQLLAQFELNKYNTSSVRDGLHWSQCNNNAGLTVTRGDNWQDALSASAFAGSNRSPILVTFDPNTVGPYLTGFLNAAGSPAGIGDQNDQFFNLTILGGPYAISAATATTMMNDLAI